MELTKFQSSFIELNLAVLFISTSGVLGRYIDLPVPVIILFRALIACIALYIYSKAKGFDFKIKNQDRTAILISGILLGLHWVTYFYALKLSNIAIGMLSLFTFPAITAILEPLVTKSKFQKSHLILSGLVLFGIYLLTPDLDFNNEHFKAICLGITSAVCYSIRNILLKSKIEHYNQSILMFNQLTIISILLLPVLWFWNSTKLIDYLPETVLLAILTTAIGHTLFIHSLKKFSTISASLISSLQPVYGIILGALFLSEYPNLNTILGGLIIISTVVIENIRLKNLSKRRTYN